MSFTYIIAIVLMSLALDADASAIQPPVSAQVLTKNYVSEFKDAVSRGNYLDAWNANNEILKQGPINKKYLALLDEYWTRSIPGFKDPEEQEGLLLMAASYIIQGVKNEQIFRNSEPYLKFTEKATESKYPANVSRALITLGMQNGEKYLSVFEKKLNDNHKIIADSAVIALAMNCRVSDDSWRSYLAKINDKKERHYATQVWVQMQSVRSDCIR